MLTINLLCVGQIKESYFKEAQNEYLKRLSKFCKINIIEVKPCESTKMSKEKQIEIESKNLLDQLRGKGICFDRCGREISSVELSEQIQKLATNGVSEISFLIGGSFGLSDDLKSKMIDKISFGKITYPHTLFRVVALEQIYRAFTIINNISYHK